MTARPSLRPRRSQRFLLAHDATSHACDALLLAAESGLGGGGSVDIVEATSVEHALAELQSASFDATFVCLNLAPAPLGGARLAHAILAEGGAVVLVTRSLRWLPSSDLTLHRLPWIAPDASPSTVARAVADAIADAAALADDAEPSSSGWRVREEVRAAARR